MMFKKSTFQMTYIGEIFTKILVLPYVGKELNMIIMLPDENTDLRTVRSAEGQWRLLAGPTGLLGSSHDVPLPFCPLALHRPEHSQPRTWFCWAALF